MIPTLYDKTGNNKIGDLTDTIECLVEEERNGIFELTMICPANSSILESIVYDNIIVADANDYLKSQKFRIYNTRKLMANRIEVCARHISFDLAHDWVDSISIENQSCEYALNTIFRNSQFSSHYKGHSDIINAQNFKVNKVTCLEAVGGTSGSIIDTYGTGAEILRDNTNIHVLNRRGRDNDVTIEYRKNLTGLEVEEDTTDLVTRIMPYAIYTDEDNQEVEVRGDFIDSPLINNYAHPYVKYIDYSEKFEDDEVPTATKLNNLATKEYTNNKVDIPKCNYKIEFIPLSKCAGYEGLEDRINLCDVVTVKDSRYSIDTQAKVIKVVFDVLRGRYDSMELGEPRTTLGDIIGGTGDGPTQGPPGPPGPQGPAGADGSIGDFPETLPEVPNITAKVYGFANIEISWTFENKVYYSYELYASKTKGFVPNTFNLIFSGQASTYLYQAEPNETWYFRACALNTHGQRTEFSEEVQVSTVKISDLSNYVESAAIGDALIGELNLGRGWYGELRGNYIDAKQMSVTDGNGKRTLDIDSFGNVNLDVASLKIKSNSVATESFVSNAKNDAINSANSNTTTALQSYYTKEQTNSQINVAKEAINLGISSTYETKTNVETKISDAIGDVQVGGANLWSETAWMDGAIMADGTVSDYWLRPHVSYHDFVSVGNNKYITYQCWNPNGIVNNANYNRIVFYNLDKTLLGSVDVPMLNGEPYQCAIWEILSGTKYIRFGVVSDVEGGGYNTSLKFKFEFGNKPTEWSPNALDITNNITTAKNDAITSANNTLNATIANYYTKSQTDSQINIAKDNITSSVSSLRTDIMNTSFTNLLLNSDFQYYQNGVNMPSHYESLDLVCCYGGGWLCPEGGKTIHINTVGSGRDWLGWKSHVIKASKDQVMTASVYVATDNINSFNSYLGLEIEWLNSNYERIVCSGSPFDLQSSHTWERKSVTGTAPEGTAYVRIYCWHHSEGISWWGKPMLQMGSVCTAWDKGGSLDAVEQRLYSAEQKITDDSITNTVKKSFYTKEETENAITSKGYATQSQLQQTSDSITSTVSQNHYTKQETENTINNKNFATSSQVQQTVDALQLKFTQSGGYNLLRNGGFENGLAFWSTNGSPEIIENQSWQNYNGKSILIRVNAPGNGIFQYFSTVPGKIYSYSFYAQAEYGTWYAGVENRHTQDIAVSPNDWRRYAGTFTATSNTHAFICYAYGDGRNVFLDNVIICEGSIPSAYTPHPSEIYDGITTIDKDGINVATSYGAHTQFHAGGMSSYNNSNQRTLGIENGGISFHSWNNNALSAYITQSSLWGGNQSANGLAISTTANGAYLALGTSSLSDVNTTLNMDQALTISANDRFQPIGINFWKDVHAHGYGIRQLSHLNLAGSGAIQFDYLNNSPSTIYEAVDSGHSLYVMGGYQMHLGVMEGSGTPHGVIWMRGKTDTHSYTHWNFHNYTMYNMKTASTYANYNTRRTGESYGVTSNVDGVRYVYRDVELVNGKAIRSIPLEYKGCEYDIVSIVCKGRGSAWVETEGENRFEINGECKSVNIEIIIYPSEAVMTASTQQLEEAPTLELPKKTEPEEALLITNEAI